MVPFWLQWSALATIHVLAKAFAGARQSRHHRAYRNTKYTRGLLVAKIFHGDQKQHSALVVRQAGEAAAEIAIRKQCLLAAVGTLQIILHDVGQTGANDLAYPAATLIGDKPVINNLIKPGAQVAIASEPSPSRKCTHEAVLYEIIGTVLIAA